MDFRILGSLEVIDAGSPVEITGQKQRALLAVLLCTRTRWCPPTG
jgi:DNA-binding SARP family transcriptional activator